MTLSPLPIDALATIGLDTPGLASGPSLDTAREQFEGVFLSLVLKEMRKTVGEGVFGGDASDTLGGLFDLTLGQELGRQGGLGITDSLARYQQVANFHTTTTHRTGGDQ